MIGAELTFERVSDSRMDFILQSAGVLENGSIRIRSYEGIVYSRTGEEKLILHATRCYESGMKNWQEAEHPIQRWDCSHLLFSFEQSSSTKNHATLQEFPVDDGSVLKKKDLFRIDQSDEQKGPLPFAGRVVACNPFGRCAVWSRNAGKILADGQTIRVEPIPPGEAYGDKKRIKDQKNNLSILTEGTLIVRKRMQNVVIIDQKKNLKDSQPGGLLGDPRDGNLMILPRGDVWISWIRRRKKGGGLFD